METGTDTNREPEGQHFSGYVGRMRFGRKAHRRERGDTPGESPMASDPQSRWWAVRRCRSQPPPVRSKKEGWALRSPSRLQARTDSVRVALLGTGGAWAGAHAPGAQLGALSWAGGPQVPKPTTTDFLGKREEIYREEKGECVKGREMSGLAGPGTGGAWAGVHAPGAQLGAAALADGPQLPGPTTPGLENKKRAGN